MSIDCSINPFNDLFSLKGKVALITGANHGLGEYFAVALASAGADIFISFHSGETDTIKAEVESFGSRFECLKGDLREEDHRAALIKKCLDCYGHIDILVNNAGCNYNVPLLDFPDEEWRRVLDVQLNAVHYLSKAVATQMRNQGGGKIINIASALSFSADINSVAYTAAKHAILGLTKAFAAELGQYKINCNAIAPGFFNTQITKTVCEKNPELYSKVSKRIPLSDGQSWGDPKDLMGAVIFLASPASDYITGEALVVDGGFKAIMI